MGFRHIHIFDHLNYKLIASFLDDIFIIFKKNEYAITLNQRLHGFNVVVIFLIILLVLVLILIIVRLHCHIKNLSIKDISGHSNRNTKLLDTSWSFFHSSFLAIFLVKHSLVYSCWNRLMNTLQAFYHLSLAMS